MLSVVYTIRVNFYTISIWFFLTVVEKFYI